MLNEYDGFQHYNIDGPLLHRAAEDYEDGPLAPLDVIKKEKNRLRKAIDQDVSILSRIETNYCMPTWLGICGIVGGLSAVVSLGRLVFTQRMSDGDFTVYLGMAIVGVSFGAYTFHKERKHTKSVESWKIEIRGKVNVYNLLEKISKNIERNNYLLAKEKQQNKTQDS